jgi:hypothetical protein
VKASLFSLAVFSLANQALAGAQAGVDFSDGFGGFVGFIAVLIFVYLCFRGDKRPPEGIPKK